MKNESISTLTIKLDISPKATCVTIYAKEAHHERTVHAPLAPMAVAQLVREWLETVEADNGLHLPEDPLAGSKIRKEQWRNISKQFVNLDA